MKRRESSFFGRVYEIVRRIPAGKVATYGQVAQMLGTRDARKVGWALHGNKNPEVPCHRVVNKEGQVALNYGGPARSFAAMAGKQEQRRKLEEEGVKFKNETQVDLERYLWEASSLR